MDVRLHNASQLAGFTKQQDLEYFLHEIADIEYRHEPLLAPSEEMLAAYKRRKTIPWDEYETEFNALIADRRIEDHIPRDFFAKPTVLLCSEPEPDNCHRRLVAEHLQCKWGDVKIIHL
ncbi:MAG: DUF488 family protein, N3 subclade [Candidatus Sumerlaeaceae bacterium]